MTRHEQLTIAVLVAYGLGLFGLGVYVGRSGDAGASQRVAEAQATIRALRTQLDARGDSLEALEVADAEAAQEEEDLEVDAAATAQTAEADIDSSETAADSIAAEIKAQVDSTVAELVVELEAQHDVQMQRARDMLKAERELSASRARRIAILEAANLELKHTVELQAQTIEEYERLDDAREGQVRSLTLQRDGVIVGGIAAVLCALLCG